MCGSRRFLGTTRVDILVGRARLDLDLVAIQDFKVWRSRRTRVPADEGFCLRAPTGVLGRRRA